MEAYKREFIDFMREVDVLTFGDFVTKSGRKTPYFVNAGRYRTGAQMQRLSGFYARAIADRLAGEVDVLFGPAYKGIPLAVGTSMAMAASGADVAFCYNRKEAKQHGEGGWLVGHELVDGDRVLIVEDVTTAGTSVRESVPLLRAVADIRLAGLVVSVDRDERGTGDRSALTQLADEFSMPTFAIVTIDEVVEHARADLSQTDLERIATYRARWGAR